MKKAAFTTSYLHYITLGIICQVFFLLLGSSAPVSADTNNFYFSDFTADYYLEPTPEGNQLKVVEQLTAEFPNYDQNHGINRSIPFTNQGGANLTAPTIDDLHFSATRNNQPEYIHDTKTDNGSYIFQLGSANQYVQGTQKYQLSYEFTNVVTDQGDFQELYWDTNGTGWEQRFDHLTANFHLPENLQDKLKDDAWCYVGAQGSNDQSRCTINKTTDGFSFTTSKLRSGENLTFVVNFAAGTFIIPPPRQDPTSLILCATAIITFIIFIITLTLIYIRTIAPKRRYYRGLATPPQYIPLRDHTVAEAADIYLKQTKPAQVATLLELAVSHKIELIKDDSGRKSTWKVHVKDIDGLTPAQLTVLQILHNSESIHADGEFSINKQKYSSTNATRARIFRTAPRNSLTAQGYFESKTRKSLLSAIGVICLLIEMGLTIALSFVTVTNIAIPIIIYSLFFASIFLLVIHSSFASKYADRTEKGLDLSNYYQGLRDYIQLAEADRLQFLQSVNGADTSKQGIVKLYERLLPYACIFGLEKSWLTELNKYYEENPDLSPSWCIGTNFTYFTLHDFNSFSRTMTSSYSSASSSSSSGSGGGGFSGGGGGGGGGGGW